MNLMDDILEKGAVIDFIAKLLKSIDIPGFRVLLTSRVIDAFTSSHEDTNEEYDLGRTKADPLALDYLRERELILSDKTKSKLDGDLKFEILEAMKANESISEITKRLDGIFTDMLPWQLERIARSEVVNAQNAGRQSAYEKSSVVKYKMVVGAKDKRLCALCRRMQGQIQPIDKPFRDPENPTKTWMYPIFHANGRCSTVPLIRLPDNVITVGGQMYAGDKKLGKIEINVEKLLKSEDPQTHEVWVKQTAKRKGHWRTIKNKI